jgi:hypothetical protein
MRHGESRSRLYGIWVGKKQRHIGVFETEEEAARARDLVAIELRGEFASLNFTQQQGGVSS